MLDAVADEIAHLHGVWHSCRALFDSPTNRYLLNYAGHNLFRLIEDAMQRDVIMTIARLCEPEQQGNKENPTLRRAISALIDGESSDRITTVARAQLSKYVDGIAKNYPELRMWRDRRLSHFDLKTARGGNRLPHLQRSVIDRIIGDMSACIELAYHEAFALDFRVDSPMPVENTSTFLGIPRDHFMQQYGDQPWDHLPQEPQGSGIETP